MLKFRKAVLGEFEMVKAFYYSIIDALEGSPYSAGWTKELYPDDQMLIDAIEKDTLYLALIDADEAASYDGSRSEFVNVGTNVEAGAAVFTPEGLEIAGAMIVNNVQDESYAKVTFAVDAADEEVYVVHALGVHAKFAGRGYAKQLVQEIIRMAKENNQKAIRLDVVPGNVPAEKTYLSQGFKFMDRINMWYADTGWMDYDIYECVL